MPAARTHGRNVALNQAAVNSTIALLLALLFLIFFFLYAAVTAQPAHAQTSVPPTARQAATMPQFAARLHPSSQNASRPPHPYSPQASYINPQNRRQRGLLPTDDVVYNNGPINGTTDAWTINFGFIVSNTFTVPSGGANLTSLSFGAWLAPGDVLQTVEVSITDSEYGGNTYFDGVVNFTQDGCIGNQYGFNVCTESGTLTVNNLAQGTYWLNLQNATVNTGDPIYWDENSGPSLASQNSVGTIPSEAFTVLGTTTTSTTYYDDYACPRPQPGFHDLHDFSANPEPSGLAIDTDGKLYGTLANGGNYGAGLLYDFAQRTGDWFLTSLYSFLGGSNGNSPNGVIVGPEGAIFGSAAGGFQTCGNGNSSCGLIYKAVPPANVCPNALCSWNETAIYQFTGNTDAWGGTVSAFDSAGNLYGFGYGGAYQRGAVFELTPSQAGWTEKILYSFTGGNDGGGPNSLLLGHDGNLYGTAGGGTHGQGVVFQLVPSAAGWTENVLYNFTGTTDGWAPLGLIQDSHGNLYGFSICYTPTEFYCGFPLVDVERGLIFALSPSGGDWSFNVIYNAGDDESDCEWYGNPTSNLIHGLTLDPAGNLYAAEGGNTFFCNPEGTYCVSLYCGQVVRVGGGVLVTGTADIFENISSDANGNLYGATSTCGVGSPSRTNGMIWQYSR